MKRVISQIIAMLILAARLASADTTWPDLKGIACVSGRPATKADVDSGRAVFVIEDGGKAIGVPLKLTVPQYAYHIDAKTNKRTPCIIIQAEEARGQKIVGCQMVPSGELMAALLTEFTLLGDKRPSTK